MGMTGDAEEAARGRAEQHGLRYVDLSRADFPPGAASLLPEATARRYRAVPVERRRDRTVVALADPTDPLVMDALRSEVDGEVVAVVAAADQVSAAIATVYGRGSGRGGRRWGRAPSSDSNGSASSLGQPDSITPPAPNGNGHSNGNHSARHAPDPQDGAWFASADALLAEAITSIPPLPPPEPEPQGPPGATSLEESLREVLAAPEVHHRLPGQESAPDPGGASTPAGGPGDAAGGPPAPPPGYGEATGRLPAGADLHWPPLARVLVTSGKVPHEAMAQALREHREAGESLARYLFNHHLATEEDLVEAMAEEVGLEYVDLSTFPVDAQAASLVPDAVARRHMVLPIRVENGVPIVAMANPTDVFAMDDLRSIMGRNFTPVVATRSQISAHLRYLQDSDSDVEEAAQSAAGVMAPGATGGFELESLQSVVEDAPIVRYVNLLILQALNERASDIHIEPTPKRLRIRFRIDGVMHDASSASPAIHASVVSRLKVLGEMDITEHRVPQEGRVSVSVGDRQIDLRLATLPTLYGETCVMRLLDKSASIRRLSELGFLPDTQERYAQSYNHPYGVILVTGPTGAGKTTTLYATLQEVMSKEKSVVTVEDPVEYQIDGITQVQINQKVGLQFSTALRSILRADPDIVLIGEIRDIETATIAMEAALSGHLVLSTLHTNTAAATPLRLTEMGIEPFLVTSAVTGVLTQRLARVLCERCKTPYEASLADFYAAGYRETDLEGLETEALWRANGCRSCSHTGYHGRMVLAEVMPVTEEIERMIIEQQSIVAMERQAVEQGMRTLRQDGLRKALLGSTTLEEVLRVVV